ncbi:MAG: stage 0 sporulation family protein [Clostridia bacterium]|nr:stage 0 sporulation family protein [Clostridia bacterium]
MRRELDEEFSTTLTGLSSPFKKDVKREAEVVDSKEFEVDIATAAYLLDDIPCGFPLPDGKGIEVVGVRFRHAGKVYFFAPGTDNYRIGEEVLVDTARGSEIGEIVMLKRRIAEKDVIQPLRAVLRKATEEDKRHEQENRQKEVEALRICADKIAAHKLDMKLVDAQYTFDNSKLLFYFTSEGRVDFRELVRDLASIFHTRIELRQIGIRDEARLIGGLGMCGRPFCCSTYLSDFGQVSIKMAKEQGLSINTSKISGCCGRLMCCLRYEHETYAAETKLTPKKDTPVSTPDGNGVVVEATPLAGTVKVKLDSAPEEAPKTYHRDNVTVLRRERNAAESEQPQKPENGSENTPEAPAE